MIHYHHRPHCRLDYRTPLEVAATWNDGGHTHKSQRPEPVNTAGEHVTRSAGSAPHDGGRSCVLVGRRGERAGPGSTPPATNRHGRSAGRRRRLGRAGVWCALAPLGRRGWCSSSFTAGMWPVRGGGQASTMRTTRPSARYDSHLSAPAWAAVRLAACSPGVGIYVVAAVDRPRWPRRYWPRGGATLGPGPSRVCSRSRASAHAKTSSRRSSSTTTSGASRIRHPWGGRHVR